jgi:HAD superfamily hydrolase (TIGR01509 family)
LIGQVDEKALILEKAMYSEEITLERGAPPIEVVFDIVKNYHGRKPMAVASSGLRTHVLASLRLCGMEKYFEHIITADQVENPKPAPDIFLLAAKMINCNPTNCR